MAAWAVPLVGVVLGALVVAFVVTYNIAWDRGRDEGLIVGAERQLRNMREQGLLLTGQHAQRLAAAYAALQPKKPKPAPKRKARR